MKNMSLKLFGYSLLLAGVLLASLSLVEQNSMGHGDPQGKTTWWHSSCWGTGTCNGCGVYTGCTFARLEGLGQNEVFGTIYDSNTEYPVRTGNVNWAPPNEGIEFAICTIAGGNEGCQLGANMTKGGCLPNFTEICLDWEEFCGSPHKPSCGYNPATGACFVGPCVEGGNGDCTGC